MKNRMWKVIVALRGRANIRCFFLAFLFLPQKEKATKEKPTTKEKFRLFFHTSSAN
jgi:hypothetical protein